MFKAIMIFITTDRHRSEPAISAVGYAGLQLYLSQCHKKGYMRQNT